jgi:hypothetical protein
VTIFINGAQSEIVWCNTVTGDMNVWFMNGAAFIRDAWFPPFADLQWQICGPIQALRHFREHLKGPFAATGGLT